MKKQFKRNEQEQYEQAKDKADKRQRHREWCKQYYYPRARYR